MVPRLALLLCSIVSLRVSCFQDSLTRQDDIMDIQNPAPTVQGILVSGGDNDSGGMTSVEVFVPSTGQSCSLPSLPGDRYQHSMDGLLICGGGYYSSDPTTCVSFSSGEWITSNTLVEERYYHTSWQTDQGTVLMGGDSGFTSEIVPMAGEQGGPSFAMEYETKFACAIPDLTSDSVIITGGLHTRKTVSRYDWQGYVEDLPSLLGGRYTHGCGSYTRGDGRQVLLVAGGYDSYRLSSTELLYADSPSWTMATPLPAGTVYGLRGINIANTLYMTGGLDKNNKVRDEILGWMDEEEEWRETGKMKMARYHHAVTTIGLDDLAMESCG